MSNFEVSPPKCEVLLLELDTTQREDVFNQQERKKLSERRHNIVSFMTLHERNDPPF